jgi:hypothetical protein
MEILLLFLPLLLLSSQNSFSIVYLLNSFYLFYLAMSEIDPKDPLTRAQQPAPGHEIRHRPGPHGSPVYYMDASTMISVYNHVMQHAVNESIKFTDRIDKAVSDPTHAQPQRVRCSISMTAQIEWEYPQGHKRTRTGSDICVFYAKTPADVLTESRNALKTAETLARKAACKHIGPRFCPPDDDVEQVRIPSMPSLTEQSAINARKRQEELEKQRAIEARARAAAAYVPPTTTQPARPPPPQSAQAVINVRKRQEALEKQRVNANRARSEAIRILPLPAPVVVAHENTTERAHDAKHPDSPLDEWDDEALLQIALDLQNQDSDVHRQEEEEKLANANMSGRALVGGRGDILTDDEVEERLEEVMDQLPEGVKLTLPEEEREEEEGSKSKLDALMASLRVYN